jgi:hypothetical protein
MSYFDQNSLQQELCAEQVLAVHFPDIKEWTANYGSFFSRNYTGDLKDCNPRDKKVSLSRNGIYDILPEKMFFDPNELRNKESRAFAQRVAELYEEERNIQKYFQPFDSYFFNRSLNIRLNVNRLVDDKVEMMLRLLFDYDLHAEKNPYIRLLAPMLLQVTELRSDFDRLSTMLAAIIDCRVDYKMPTQDRVLFTVHKLQLNSREYADFMLLLKPLFDFVQEWFVPMEMDCGYQVKDYQQPFVLSDDRALVLDYNTQI